MNSELLTISILHEEGSKDPAFPRLLRDVAGVKLLQEASSPENFWALHQKETPDIVLIDLNSLSQVPGWLPPFINRLPRSEIIVSSQCLDSEFLLRLLELHVQFIPIPLSKDNLEAAVMRARNKRQESSGELNVSHLVTVAGSREGVGITSLATNLALALAELGPERVVLLDLARPFPAVGQFLDLKESHNILDLIQGADNLDRLFLEKILQKFRPNLSIILGNPDLTLDSELLLSGHALDKILKALRSIFRWIVVDLGYWIDALYLRIVREADVVLFLSELSVPDLQNLGRIKNLLYRHNFDFTKVKVIVNRYEKKSILELKDLEKIFVQPVFFRLPSDYYCMEEAINQGEPLGEIAPKSKLWRSVKKLAKELEAQLEGSGREETSAKKGLWQRLFSS